MRKKIVIAWWKQPGNQTMKRQTINGTKHVSIEQAKIEIDILYKSGWKITEYDHKITAERE